MRYIRRYPAPKPPTTPNERSDNWWIEPAIKIILVVSAMLVASGTVTVVHFVRKFW